MDTIKVNVLGNFDILVNGESVISCIGKAQKGATFLRYLVLHRDREVPRTDLYDVLWPNEDCKNPESALKTLVSRLRNTLETCSRGFGAIIHSKRGAYQWNNHFPHTLDLADFERICNSLKNVQELTDQTRDLYKRVLSVYNGDLFVKEAQDIWVISTGVYLHNLYETTICRYLDLLREEEEYDEIIAVSRTALGIDAFNETFHIALMDALVKTNRNHEALKQYKHAKNIHLRYLGIQPPKGILDFYMNIIQGGQVLEMDIASIHRELCTSDTATGAFVCEYTVFKEIYNFKLRSYERIKKALYLALIMLKRADGRLMDPVRLDDLMSDLLEVLKIYLRKGDIITQYSASQYALLMPLQSHSEGDYVLDRIKAAYYGSHTNSFVTIDCRLGPIADYYDQT